MDKMTSSGPQVDGALEKCKNFSQSNNTLPQVVKGAADDTDFGAVMYIIAVLTFYSLGIVVMIVKYLKTERKEMEEEMVLESFFKGIPDKRVEHEIESVNRVAIHAFHTLTASRAMSRGEIIPNKLSLERSYTDTSPGSRDSEEHSLKYYGSHSSHPDYFDNHKHKSLPLQLNHYQADAVHYQKGYRNSFSGHAGQRCIRYEGQNPIDSDMTECGEPDDLFAFLNQDPNGIGHISDMGACESESQIQYRLCSKDKSVFNSNPQKSGICQDVSPGDIAPVHKTMGSSSIRIYENYPGNEKGDSEKRQAKRMKSVIFFDAVKPNHKLEDLSVSYNSNNLCPNPGNSRRFSNSVEIIGNDVPSNNNIIISHGSSAEDFNSVTTLKSVTKQCDNFQEDSSNDQKLAELCNSKYKKTTKTGKVSPSILKLNRLPLNLESIPKDTRTLEGDDSNSMHAPVNVKEIKHDETLNRSIDTDIDESHTLPLNSSHSALCGKGRQTLSRESRDSVERSFNEKENGAFKNECSRLNLSKKHVHQYNSMSSRPVTTRVKIIDPDKKNGSAKKVLVTDL